LRKGTPIDTTVRDTLADGLRALPRYVWLTSGDEKVRPSHAANDGKIFYWSDPPSTGHPGEDINCRCVAVPYADLQDTAILVGSAAFAITPANRARVLASRVLREAARQLAQLIKPRSRGAVDKPKPDLKDTRSWPKPPREGKYREGDPSRNKPRSRGEKSLYDEKGGEWRYSPKGKHHDEVHWDYKPAGKAQKWQNISIDGKVISK
jgi:hypothetical protein